MRGRSWCPLSVTALSVTRVACCGYEKARWFACYCYCVPFRQVGDRFDSLGDLAQLVIESEADIGEEGTSPGGCAIWRARAKASFGAFEFRSACFGGWTCKTAGVTPPHRHCIGPPQASRAKCSRMWSSTSTRCSSPSPAPPCGFRIKGKPSNTHPKLRQGHEREFDYHASKSPQPVSSIVLSNHPVRSRLGIGMPHKCSQAGHCEDLPDRPD